MDTQNAFAAGMPLRTTLVSAWRAPWRAGHAIVRMFALCMAVTFGQLALLYLVALPAHRHLPVLDFCLGVAAAWAGVLAGLSLLAADARRLRLPGVARLLALSLLVHAALTLLLAWLLFAPFGIDLVFALLATALAMAAGLCAMLAPRWLLLALVVGLAAPLALHDLLALPGWDDARWLWWGGAALLALLAASAWCWRALPTGAGSGTTLVWQFALLDEASGRAGADIAARRLRQAGPRRPRLALRVALGGAYLPRRLSGYLRTGGELLAGALLLFAGLQFGAPHLLHDVLAKDTARRLMLGGGLFLQFGSTFYLFHAYVSLRRLWLGAPGGLSLLAVLPGLGRTAAHARANLLRAMLMVPLAWWALSLLVLWAIAHALAMEGTALWLALCPAWATACLFVALALRLPAGRRVPMAGEIVPPCLLAILYFFTLPAGFVRERGIPLPGAAWAENALLFAWLAFGASLAWLALRHGRAFAARPHPFLPAADEVHV